MARRPTTLDHGPYVIRADILDGEPTARVFVRNARQGAGVVLDATGDSVEEAIAAAIERLDEIDRAARAERRTSGDWIIPSESEFRRALKAVKTTDAQKAMLRAHAAAGDDGLTAGELARAAGVRDHSAANLHYGLLGDAMARYLDVRLPAGDPAPGDAVATGILAAPGAQRADLFVWVMHPELRRALDAPR